MAEIVVVANPDKPEAVRLAGEVEREFVGRGFGVRVSFGYDDDLSGESADMVVVFGGDGTVLGAVQRFAGHVPPILAFNVGRLGYLAGNPPERVVERIDDACEGRLTSSSRMMLEMRVVTNNVETWRGLALNEIVLSPSRPGRMVPLSVVVDEEDVMFNRGDGIIVSTPTGSTAYALSAGGPVASPELDAIIIAPICPHQLANRPLVLGPEEKVRLGHYGDQPVDLTVDGARCHRVDSGAVVEVSASRQRVRLLSPRRGKFKILREKLGWGWGEDKFVKEMQRYDI